MKTIPARSLLLFRNTNGQLTPALPFTSVRGPNRTADGVEFLTVDQAMKQSGLSRADLLRQWISAMADLLSPDERQHLRNLLQRLTAKGTP